MLPGNKVNSPLGVNGIKQVEGEGRSFYRGEPGCSLPLPQEGDKEKEAAWECSVWSKPPSSKGEHGEDWMLGNVDEAVQQGIPKPALKSDP